MILASSMICVAEEETSDQAAVYEIPHRVLYGCSRYLFVKRKKDWSDCYGDNKSKEFIMQHLPELISQCEKERLVTLESLQKDVKEAALELAKKQKKLAEHDAWVLEHKEKARIAQKKLEEHFGVSLTSNEFLKQSL